MKRKVILASGVFGIVMAFVVLGFNFLKNYGYIRVDSHLAARMQVLSLAFCPPSFGLSAGDNAPWPMQIVATLFVAVANAGLYALLGALLLRVSEHLQNKPGRD